MNGRKLIGYVYAFSIWLCQYATAQSYLEVGNLPIQNFTPAEYNAFRQNWGIVEDSRGLIYVANKWGILEYDGTNWQKLKNFPEEAEPKALVKDVNGRIWVGGFNELGYCMPDSSGTLTYRPLMHLLPAPQQDFGQIWNGVQLDKTIVFWSEKSLLLAKDTRSVVHISAPDVIWFAFTHDNALYVQVRGKGLMKLKNDSLVLVNNHAVYRQSALVGVVPLSPQTLGAFTSDGMWEVPTQDDISGEPTPYSTGFDRMRKGKIHGAVALGGLRIAVSIASEGVVIINKNGSIVQLINKQAGLQDEMVNRMYTDTRNLLWMATANGISLAIENSPLSSKAEEDKLEGTIESVTRYQGKLMVGTHNGLYQFGAGNGNRISELSDLKPVFSKHPDFNQTCWVVAPVADLLFVAADDGLYAVNASNTSRKLYSRHPVIFSIVPSAQFSGSVWLGTRDGLVLITRKGEQWIETAFLPTNEDVRSVVESEEGVWCAGHEKGVLYRLVNPQWKNDKLEYTQWKKYGSESGIPAAGMTLVQHQNKLLLASGLGLYEWNPVTERAKASSLLGPMFADTTANISRIKLDAKGHFWIFKHSEKSGRSFGISKSMPDGRYLWDEHYFKSVAKEDIMAIHCDDDGVVWFGGPGGLHRFDLAEAEESTQRIPVLVRKTQFGNRIYFNGTFFDESGNVRIHQTSLFRPMIQYENNSFNVSFSAVHFDVGTSLTYSYKLLGVDPGWSAPQKVNAINYSNLNHGSYTFYVKCIDENGTESEPTVFTFTILPPWYETGWFYLAQTAFLLSLVVVSYVSNRNPKVSRLSSILTLITIITIFEILVTLVEPFLDDYSGGVPVFKLSMNVVLALSLNPLEGLARRVLSPKSD